MNIPRITSEGFIPPARSKPDTVKASANDSTGDVFKPEQNERLMNLLQAEPDARPEAIARARALIADRSYPSPDQLEHVVRGLLKQGGHSK